MRGGVRWRISARERALLAIAAAIIGALQKMDGAIPPRDRRTAFRFVRTLSRIGGQSGYAEEKTRAAWQSMPAYLRHGVAELAKAAACADELQRVIGDAWPEDQPSRLPLRTEGAGDCQSRPKSKKMAVIEDQVPKMGS
jgi:hypothetical protein